MNLKPKYNSLYTISTLYDRIPSDCLFEIAALDKHAYIHLRSAPNRSMYNDRHIFKLF